MLYKAFIQLLLAPWFVLVLTIPFNSYSQNSTSLNKVKQTPFWLNNNPKKLANYLTKGLSTDREKIIAISSWISKKIKYDINGFQKGRLEVYSDKKVLKWRRRAMCGEYAHLLKTMCDEIGIESIEVSGYTHAIDHLSGDDMYRTDHAWNLVKDENQWFLFDLTWASGYSKPRLQLIRKTMFLWFGIPYQPKLKYVKQFDTKMFFANPDSFALTHYPLINEFQLLDYPISYSAFIYGTDSIVSETKSTITKPNIGVDDFYNQNIIAKWNSLSNYGFQNNPKNHRVKGVYGAFEVDSICRKGYDANLNLLLLSPLELSTIKTKALLADSFLQQALNDNKLEYKFYNERSTKWKNDLKSVNKKMQKLISANIKSNNIEKKVLVQTKNQITSGSNMANSKSKAIKPSQILNTKRPKKGSDKKSQQALIYANQSDSLNLEALKHLRIKDSIFSLLDWAFYNKIISNEEHILSIRKEVKQEHKSILFSKRLFGVNYYTDSTLVHKPIVDSTLKIASKVNLEVTDSLLVLFLGIQKVAYKEMKTYSRLESKSIKTIKKVKRKLVDDNGEDELFLQKLNDYKGELRKYKTSIKRIKEDKRIKKLLNSSNKKLKKLRKQLTKETNYETFRHNSYKDYIKFKKTHEDEIVSGFRKSLKISIQRINRTENYREKQREKENSK